MFFAFWPLWAVLGDILSKITPGHLQFVTFVIWSLTCDIQSINWINLWNLNENSVRTNESHSKVTDNGNLKKLKGQIHSFSQVYSFSGLKGIAGLLHSQKNI